MNPLLLTCRKETPPFEARKESALPPIEEVEVLGLRIARLTFAQTVDRVEALIQQGQPSFFITANLHYAMLSSRESRLAEVNRKAAFLVADGMPLVWYSRLWSKGVPERVTGADLVWGLCERAAERGYRVFLLGGRPGVAEAAGAVLQHRYPRLQIAGIEAPNALESLSPEEHRALLERIGQAKAHLLFAALGQPKGELWLAEHLEKIGVPVGVQIGASLDFVVGRVPRAPCWVQRSGLEWLWRVAREPVRLTPRYVSDALFLVRWTLRNLKKS